MLRKRENFESKTFTQNKSKCPAGDKIDPDTFGELQEADKGGGKKKSVFLAQDITLPSGRILAAGQQQMTDKEIDEAQQAYSGQEIFSQAPTGKFRYVEKIDNILVKIKNKRLFKETLGGCVIKMVNQTVILTKEH